MPYSDIISSFEIYFGQRVWSKEIIDCLDRGNKEQKRILVEIFRVLRRYSVHCNVLPSRAESRSHAEFSNAIRFVQD